jgi:endonuclease/exonuclease/phosphatase family metal-dependent hydrolase
MKLVCLNIEGGKHLHRWLPRVRSLAPDIVCLQEVFSSDMPKIANLLQMRITYLPQDYVPRSSFDRMRGCGAIGIAILHKLPASGIASYYYGASEDITAAPQSRRALLVVTFESNGLKTHIANLHFTWSHGGKNTREQRRDMKQLLEYSARYQDLILCGDFNIPRGTALFSELQSSFTSWVPAHYRSSLDPFLFRNPSIELVVDHLLTRGTYGCTDVRLLTGCSDHRAIVANLHTAELQQEHSKAA